jgi:hypothetical protein
MQFDVKIRFHFCERSCVKKLSEQPWPLKMLVDKGRECGVSPFCRTIFGVNRPLLPAYSDKSMVNKTCHAFAARRGCSDVKFQYEVLELALIIPITGTVIACLQRCIVFDIARVVT